MPQDVIGWIRVFVPRYAAKGQYDAMLANNIPKAIQVGPIREDDVPAGLKLARGDREALLTNVRYRGNGSRATVAVLHAHLLADPSKRGKRGGTRQDFWNVLDALEAEKAVIWELYTGRRSSKPAEREAMVRDAIETLAKGRHKTRDSDKRGRPPKPFTEAQWDQAQRAWDSRKLPTYEAVRAKLPKGMTTRDCWNKFGARNTEEA